jgi:hypothetical protein
MSKVTKVYYGFVIPKENALKKNKKKLPHSPSASAWQGTSQTGTLCIYVLSVGAARATSKP